MKKESKHTILILGASGFIGGALYKELCSYFKTFGTYCQNNTLLETNKHFFQYNIEEDDVFDILNAVKPTIIISAIRGNFAAQLIAHRHITEYLKQHSSKLIFLSSANVFDAYSKYPSYETDTTLSNSIYGHFKIKIEHMLLKIPKKKAAIIRLPMVFGSQSPRIKEYKTLLQDNLPIEVFPNLIMNVTTNTKVTQQIHYIINRNKYGIFHLGSKDLVHHDDFVKDIATNLNGKIPKFKNVFTTNDSRYLAVLPKNNMLPKHLQINSADVLKDINKNEETY